MRVIITGGTGLLGRALAASLIRDEHEVIALSRNPQKGVNMEVGGAQVVRWDAKSATGWGQLAEGADAIVNLAGANLSGGRWTTERKREIVEGRVDAGRAVVQAVEMAQIKPKMVLQASGISYYGTEDAGVMTEDCPRGDDFLANVCEAWENSSSGVEQMGVRRVVTRCGVVLAKNSGALPRMALPYKFFVGGPVASGKQWMSWVHYQDVIGAFRFLIENDTAVGVYNLTSPEPVVNKQFARAMGKAMGRPAWIPVPAFVLRLMFGEMSTVVLDGQQGVPRRLQEQGYRFQFPSIQGAMDDIYKG